jgi:cysteine-rich repeat protein
MNGDGCDSTCQKEVGFNCSVAGSACTVICGDLLIISIETCDDGNSISGDGCSASCMKENGYLCPNVNKTGGVCTSICGDGILVLG